MQVAENPTPVSREQLILDHYQTVHRVARHIARRYPSQMSVDDLVSIGTLGLIEAVDRYDQDRCSSFTGYAQIRIKGAMVDALRKGDWVPRSVRLRARALGEVRTRLQRRLGRDPVREELAEALDLCPEELEKMEQLAQVYELASIDQLRRESTQRLGDTLRSREASPEEHAVRQHRRDRVSRAVDDLPERDRLIVQMYYYKGLNLKEIALVLDVSESRVSQLLSRIRTRLGQVLADAV